MHRSFTVSEFEYFAENIGVFYAGLSWVRNYLAQPHPELGRAGAVCPFVPAALDGDTIHIAVVRLSGENKQTQILDAIQHHLEAFLSTAAAGDERMLRTTLMLFPDVSLDEAPELIDRTKEDLKSSFVQRGLMLGEFHARNESPGLHNPEFKPLRSPAPMLAIRRMVSTDFAFLNRPEYDVDTRLRYLDAYLSVPGIPASSRREVERTVASLRAELDSGTLTS